MAASWGQFCPAITLERVSAHSQAGAVSYSLLTSSCYSAPTSMTDRVSHAAQVLSQCLQS